MSKRAEERASEYANSPRPEKTSYEEYLAGYEQAEKDLIPIIDRLTEAILFDWLNMDEVAKEAAIEIALNHHE